jgi:hypothetical protein
LRIGIAISLVMTSDQGKGLRLQAVKAQAVKRRVRAGEGGFRAVAAVRAL